MELGEFHDAFFDECNEHLDNMEQTLLTIDIALPSPDDINLLFRCAHSIKGGGGMFGLTPIADITHRMESLFSSVRNQSSALDKQAISLLLKSIDELRRLVEDYRSENIQAPSADRQLIKNLDSLIAPQSDEDEFALFAPIVEESEPDIPFFAPIENDAETPQQAVEQAKPKQSASSLSSTLRVKAEKVDLVMNQLGELVISHSILRNLSQHAVGNQGEVFEQALDTLSQQIRDLQTSVMSIRMLPVDELFNRFNRVVHDVANMAEKQVTLNLKGLSTEIDKTMIEKLTDPLTHLIRNAIDHGIESPKTRRENNKPEQGQVELSAYQQGGVVTITIKDDGGGLDRNKIVNRARDKGIHVPENAADETIWNLIFAPGFTTAEQVSDLSGRGVGMDVVKRNIEELGGSITIQSRKNQGTTITLVLPLTLAILDGMLVSVDDFTYIIPLLNIVESFQPDATHFKQISNEPLIYSRGQYWPVVSLAEASLSTLTTDELTQFIVVLLRTATSRVALLVDVLIGDQQVVIKSLEKHYKSVKNVAAATILGNGNVGLILDVEQLCSQVSVPEFSGDTETNDEG